MSDDKSKRGPHDRKRVNINQTYECRDWAVALGVTQVRLREAVKAAGPMVENVKAWLIAKIKAA